MNHITIDCDDPDWSLRLHLHLSERRDVDLINLDFGAYGALCENLARTYSMELRLDRDPMVKAVKFRSACNVIRH